MSTASGKIGVEEYVENFLAENSALRRKLQSKAEALLILSKELDQCRTERDQFKLMAEQLQDRYTSLKKKSFDLGLNQSSLFAADADCYDSENSVLQILNETKEKNKAMKIEIEDLRQKLRDAQGDVKVLRLRVNQQRNFNMSGDNKNFPSHQREELVQQLETMSVKCTQMEADLQSILDEKEELITERDSYKCKVHRLNHELTTLLKGDGKTIMDVDALVMENRYLQDRLQQSEEEKELVSQALSKYKSMLDKKHSKGTVKLGANSSAGMVMTHKQVQQLLEHGTSSQMPNTAATLADMKSLCLALLESLGDKSLAFSHQKKANRILARRVSELEQRLNVVQGGSVAVFPSQVLLEGYTNSEVDRDVSRILDEDSSDSEGDTIEENCQRVRCGGRESGVENHTKSTEKSYLNDTASTEGQTMRGVEKFLNSSKCSTSNKFSIQKKQMCSNTSAEDSGLHLSTQNEGLPLELQLLVQKALDEINQDHSNKDPS